MSASTERDDAAVVAQSLGVQVQRPILDRSRLHGELASMIDRGQPVLVVARQSCERSAEARRAAADDYDVAIRKLASKGIDIRHLVPSKEDIAERLRVTTDVVTTGEGKERFTNRFVEIDLTHRGVYVVVSCGSGRKLDEEDLSQPAVMRAARLVQRLDLALLFAKRLDRLARHAWAIGPLMIALEVTGKRLKCLPFLGDERWELAQPSAASDFRVFFEIKAAQEEADLIPGKTRNGMVQHTGDRMVNGQVPYGTGACPPPGLAVVRLRDRTGGLGRALLFLETDGCRPDPSTVAAGMPGVHGLDTDGQAGPVDQVANVRWALAHLGKPGWGHAAVGEELAARRYSTEGLRRQAGRAAHFVAPADLELRRKWANQVTRGIVDNLDVYENGRLVIPLGVEGFDDLVIENVLPPDGPWAQPRDFARIRAYQEHWRERFDSRLHLTFSKLRVDVDGFPCRLRPVVDRDGEDSYAFEITEGPDRLLAPPHARGVNIPARSLAMWLTRALNEAPEVPLDPFFDNAVADTRLSALRATEQQLEQDLRACRGLQDRLYQTMMETGPSGQRIVTGATLARLQAELNAAQEPEPDLRAQLAAAQRDIAAIEAEQVGMRGLPQGRLLQFVSSLQDFRDPTFQLAWRDALPGLQVEASRFKECSLRGARVKLSGTIVVHDEAQMWAVPLTGEVISGQAAQIPDRIVAAVDGMRDGIPAAELLRSMLVPLRARLAAGLGAGPDACVVPSVLDPRLLRVSMAVLHPANGARLPGYAYRTSTECPVLADVPVTVERLPALAEELDEPQVLLERVLRVHDPRTVNRVRWYRSCSVRLVEALALLSEHGSAAAATRNTKADLAAHLARTAGHFPGEFEGVGWRRQLRACEFCGVRRPLLLALGEVDGTVCAGCRHDRAGVLWPGQPYDIYLAHPDVWQRFAPSTVALVRMPPAGFGKGNNTGLMVLRRHDALQEWLQAGVGAADHVGPKTDTFPEAQTTPVRRLVSPQAAPRDVAELTEAERHDFLAAYRDRTRTVAEVCRQFGLRRTDLDAYLAALGEPRRRIVRRDLRERNAQARLIRTQVLDEELTA